MTRWQDRFSRIESPPYNDYTGFTWLPFSCASEADNMKTNEKKNSSKKKTTYFRTNDLEDRSKDMKVEGDEVTAQDGMKTTYAQLGKLR